MTILIRNKGSELMGGGGRDAIPNVFLHLQSRYVLTREKEF